MIVQVGEPRIISMLNFCTFDFFNFLGNLVRWFLPLVHEVIVMVGVVVRYFVDEVCGYTVIVIRDIINCSY